MKGAPILSLQQIEEYDPSQRGGAQGAAGRYLCPLCGEGKPKDTAHRSLSLNRSTGLWKCFRCQAGGQVREFWSERPASPPRAAARASLRAAFQLETPSVPASPARPVFPFPVPPPELSPAVFPQSPSSSPDTPGDEATTAFAAPPSPQEPHQTLAAPSLAPSDWAARWEATTPLTATPGEAYLQGRGIAPTIAQVAGVRWSPNWSGHGAVVFPIRDRAANLVAAQARAIRGVAKLTAGPKKEGVFLAPVTLASGRVCGPFDRAVPALIVVEAPIDALSLAACGFPALALCGTSGPSWLHIACGLRPVQLAFDADAAGERAFEETRQRLEPFGAHCTRLRPEGGKDWNEWLLGVGVPEMSDWLSYRLLLAQG